MNHQSGRLAPARGRLSSGPTSAQRAHGPALVVVAAAGLPPRPASSLGRDAEDDGELRGQFADLRVLHLGELDGDGVALLALGDVQVDAVALVARVALDV